MATELTVIAGIIAIVEAVKRQAPALAGIYTVALALILGGVAGYLALEGMTIQQGIMAGLAAVGTHTVARRVGGGE